VSILIASDLPAEEISALEEETKSILTWILFSTSFSRTPSCPNIVEVISKVIRKRLRGNHETRSCFIPRHNNGLIPTHADVLKKRKSHKANILVGPLVASKHIPTRLMRNAAQDKTTLETHLGKLTIEGVHFFDEDRILGGEAKKEVLISRLRCLD
jgi:hypothetical protein